MPTRPLCSIVAFVLCIYIGANMDYDLLDITRLCRFPGNKWSTMSIHSYFTIKKRDVPKDNLEKAVPASMINSEIRTAAHIRYEAYDRWRR